MASLSGAEKTARWRANNPEKLRAYLQSDHRKALCRDATARWRARNPKPKKSLPPPLTRDELEEKRLRRLATYQNNWKARTNGHAPCLDFPPPPLDSKCFNCGTVAKLHLDHDHSTGKYRGYLCIACNMGIGQLGDTIEGLERALAYLKSAKG